jgi:hypothetical protein
MSTHTITLGAVALPVEAIPLGRLRKIVVTFNAVGRAFAHGAVDDAVLDQVFQLLSLGTGKPVAELEEMPGTYPQLLEAVNVIAEVCGLRPKEGDAPGEARPGIASPA